MDQCGENGPENKHDIAKTPVPTDTHDIQTALYKCKNIEPILANGGINDYDVADDRNRMSPKR